MSIPVSLPDAALDATKIVVDYVGKQLDERLKKRDRLETRTSLVVTSSGGLVTVVGVIAALLPKPEVPFQLRAGLMIVLAFAVISLLAAVAVAQLASVLLSRPEWPDSAQRVKEISELRDIASIISACQALGCIQESHLAGIEKIDSYCYTRSLWLQRAGFLQMLGVLLLGGGLIVFLLGSLPQPA